MSVLTSVTGPDETVNHMFNLKCPSNCNPIVLFTLNICCKQPRSSHRPPVCQDEVKRRALSRISLMAVKKKKMLVKHNPVWFFPSGEWMWTWLKSLQRGWAPVWMCYNVMTPYTRTLVSDMLEKQICTFLALQVCIKHLSRNAII